MPEDLLAQNVMLDDDALIDDAVDENPMYALPVEEEDPLEKVVPLAPLDEEAVEGEDSDLDGGEEDNDEEELE